MALKATERFSERAGDYRRYRPTYPTEIIEAVLDGFSAPVVADVGAGTGIGSHLLAERASLVFAIEPNAPMREAIAPHERIRVVDATAEATTLDNGVVDVVASFQALHWFDRERAFHEFRRVLRVPGRVAAIWNQRDEADGFTREYDAVIARYGERVKPVDRTHRKRDLESDFECAGYTNLRTVQVAHRQSVDWYGLIGFVRSCSYLPRSGQAYTEMETELRELYERWADGKNVSFAWIAEAHLAER